MSRRGSTKKQHGARSVAKASGGPLMLRVTDQETARVVAVHRADGEIVGAGCLVDNKRILTCRHVVAAALLPKAAGVGKMLPVTLVGVEDQRTVHATVSDLGGEGPENDLALLEIQDEPDLRITPVEFACPLRHGGKNYSVLGFPGGDQQGRNARGILHASDARGLVQMDKGGALSVLGGFSGAPVWSSDVGGFVGIVVTELANADVSWCIPSRRLCRFFPDLLVKFRIPPTDRPVVHDYWEDEPNEQLFGTVSDNGKRRLTAVIKERKYDYKVSLTFECIDDTDPLRGGVVTFINYPDFSDEDEDGYELFARIDGNKAVTTIKPGSLFTVAAIGDGGDTALTLDLEALWSSPKKRPA